MAYTKTTWNNLSNPPINADNLNKIEQGIYDNSLGIDKINPSGTATTTAEIEEGQITDVIGFKSLKLKGQTSQYTTTGKNKLENDTFVQGSYLDNTMTTRISCRNTKLKANKTYTISSTLNYSNYNIAIVTSENQFPLVDGSSVVYDSGWKSANFNFTVGNNDVYINIAIKKLPDGATITPNDVKGIKFQIEEGSSATSYEPYTGGKASPNPDFPQDVNNVSGYNVIEISNVNKLPYAQSGSYAVSGMTHTSNGKGTYTLNGTATANSRYDWEIEPYTIKQGDYLYLGNTATNSTVTVALLENASTQIMYTGPTQVNRIVSLNNYVGRKVTYIRTYTNAQTLTNFVLKPMICTTTSVSDFVEHQGNNFEINLGKNLMKAKSLVEATVNGITFTPVYDGNKLLYVNVNGTSTAVATYTLQNANVDSASTYVDELSAGTYTLSDFSGNNTPNIAIFLRYTTNGSTFTTQNSVDNKTFTVSSKIKYASYIRIASGTTINNMKFYPQIEKGAIATNYASFFPPIEICKIGTFQDYIFKRDGKWWKHKAIGKKILNGTENWVLESNYSRFNVQNLITDYLASERGRALCTHYTQGDTSTEGHFGLSPSNNYLYMHFPSADVDTVAEFKEWLSSHNVSIYYVLTNSVDEEITYAPLLRQLDELYNSGLYDVTNISQENSSEAFILDMEACKNNINGIVEYIRR